MDVASLDAEAAAAARGLVEGYVDAWNRHDMAAMAALFAEDAHWINIVGMHWAGRAALMGAHGAMHASFFRTTEQALLAVEVRAVAPGAAVAVAHARMPAFTPPDGTVRPAAGNRLSFVLVRRPEGWRIVQGHNTVIDPAARLERPEAGADEAAPAGR